MAEDFNSSYFAGWHNAAGRHDKDRQYKDRSTICVVPCVGPIPPKVVFTWRNLMAPMNQKFFMMMAEKMEVGEAYNWAIENILANKDLASWKYILTLETDNLPPADGLLRLLESIETARNNHGKPYSAVAGLYWTKGPDGQPMCYGRPEVMPMSFAPFLPETEGVHQCNGVAMGFTLYDIEMFKRHPGPWFKTEQSVTPGVGARAYTQDLWACERFLKAGESFAVDTRVKVGHYDYANDFVW